jgi:hypothetical protein
MLQRKIMSGGLKEEFIDKRIGLAQNQGSTLYTLPRVLIGGHIKHVSIGYTLTVLFSFFKIDVILKSKPPSF